MQQEVLKFNDICVSWSFPKTWLGGEFCKLRKSKFWESQFFSIITSKWVFDIPLLINLFISWIELKEHPLKTSIKRTQV